jgi:hypothetical protein
MAFKQLRLAADAAGLHWDDQTTASGGFQYPIVSAPPFMLTVSNIPAVGDLPNAADYRTSLAEAFNAAFTRPKLRDRPVEAARPMYGILIYTVTKATGTAGYLGVGFPTDDYSEWISVFSMAELMEAYDRRSTEQPKKQDDNVNPRIRREKKEGNEE